MKTDLIREITAMHEAEYQGIRRRLMQVGLQHMALDTFREHLDARLTIPVGFALIDALAILAAAEEARVHPDIVVELLVRKALPGGYYFRGAHDLLRQLEATADAVGTLNAQGIPYQAVGPGQLEEMVRRNLEKMDRTSRDDEKG